MATRGVARGDAQARGLTESGMIFTWEQIALIVSWWFTTIGGAVWIERRLARMERDISWLIGAEQRRARVIDVASS